MKILYTSVLVLALVATALADFPFKKKPQEFTTHVPADVANTLRSGTPVQRNDLALELGILAPNPSGAAKSNSPCVDFHHVEQRPATLRAGAENVVLLADSTECDSLYVVVFDKAPKSEWRHVQTVRLPSRAQRPEVTFADLIQPGVSEIVLHHETDRDSGSVQQENFVVLKMQHDRVEAVLDTTEHSELTLTNRSAAETDNLQQTQTSTFSLLKSPPNSAALFRIFEKQVVTDNKTTITRYQVWTWDPELERFRSSPIDGGDVKPAPPAKKPPAKTPGAAQPPAAKPAPPPTKPEPK
jgi:hypothetical protein